MAVVCFFWTPGTNVVVMLCVLCVEVCFVAGDPGNVATVAGAGACGRDWVPKHGRFAAICVLFDAFVSGVFAIGVVDGACCVCGKGGITF